MRPIFEEIAFMVIISYIRMSITFIEPEDFISIRRTSVERRIANNDYVSG